MVEENLAAVHGYIWLYARGHNDCRPFFARELSWDGEVLLLLGLQPMAAIGDR